MYRKKFFNKEVAIDLQRKAQTAEEADRHMKETCGICNKQAFCIEHRCSVWREHQTRLLAIEAEKETAGKPICTFHITRDYKISATGAAKRALAYFVKKADVPNWQVAKSTQFLKNIEERNFGDLEQNLLGVAGTRGRLPAGEWGEILKLIRAVLKAAKEV